MALASDRRGRWPTFIVIGAMKAGTTSLHRYLADHPSIVMSEPKELDFFVGRLNWGRGAPWYRSHFPDLPGIAAWGESSPTYSQRHLDDRVAERIHRLVPGVRLIYLVREPRARMRSMYLHEVLDGRETRPVGRALVEDRGYLDASRYAYQLEPYLELFPEDHIMVETAERLAEDPEGTVADLWEFVGVEQIPVAARYRANVTSEKRRDLALGRWLKNRPEYLARISGSWRMARIHERLLTRPAHLPDVPEAIAGLDALEAELADDRRRLEAIIGRRLAEWNRPSQDVPM